jgi:hypothetical protein
MGERGARSTTGERRDTEADNELRRERDLTTDGKNYLQDVIMNDIHTQLSHQLAIIQSNGASKNNYIN